MQIYNIFTFFKYCKQNFVCIFTEKFCIMKLYGLLALFIVFSCKEDAETLSSYFSIDNNSLKLAHYPNQTLSLKVENSKNKKIDSVSYFINDVNIGSVKKNNIFNYALANEKLGNKTIKAIVYFDGKDATITQSTTIFAEKDMIALSYEIINTYPHDSKAYTQGLEFFNDVLYEGTGNGAGVGTGNRGKSSIRKVDYKTGKVLKITELSDAIFGEGITILNNKLYQLTYKNNEAYVYDVNTFEKLHTLSYFKDMEGWGLTNDGTNLYMSNGSEKIYKLNPNNFEQLDYISVYTKNSLIDAVNELEWIDGKIWANIYTKDAVAIINPNNGAVENVIDFSDLINKVTHHPDLDYLNGIAYNPKTKTLFVTGKNWDKIFEVKIK